MLNVAVIFLSADLINIQNRKRSGWFILSISMNIGMRLERNKNNNKQNKQTNKQNKNNKQTTTTYTNNVSYKNVDKYSMCTFQLNSFMT
jgi:hypothetical protein